MHILKFTPEEAIEIESSSASLEAALKYVAALVTENKIGRGEVRITIQRPRRRSA